MLRTRDSEAKNILRGVVSRTLEIIKKNAEEHSVGALIASASSKSTIASSAAKTSGQANSGSAETPTIEFRMQTCRFLTELAMWKESVQIAESVIGDDDENVEAWYLLAFALFRLKKYATAEECCTNVKNLIIKLKIVDSELEAGTMEIYQEILKQKGKQQ